MIHTLRHIVQRVSQAETVERSVDKLVSLTRDAMQADCCSLYLQDGKGLVLCATKGLSPDAVGQARLQVGEGIVGTVAQREEILNLADAPAHPAFKRLPEAQEDAFRAFLAVPLIHRRKLVGVLTVQQCIARQFSEEEESFVITLASQLAPELRERALTRTFQRRQQHFSALCAAPGIAIARSRLARPRVDLNQAPKRSDHPEREWTRLTKALERTAEELQVLALRLGEELGQEGHQIFDSFQLLLTDKTLRRGLEQHCQRGWRAETAVCAVVLDTVRRFEAMEDLYLRERAADIRDLGQRVLDQLARRDEALQQEGHPIILVAREITATMLAEVPPERLAGLISLRGGVNSHAAILARAMGIPALVAVDGARLSQLSDKPLLLDALEGQFWIDPDTALVKQYRLIQRSREQRQADLQQGLSLPCTSEDGMAVSLQVNADLHPEFEILGQAGVGGIGLFRTEALFMSFSQFPTEQQQERYYLKVLQQAPEKPVVIRTLDVGGDKPLPYLPIREDNPFLGWRGVRVSLDHPELFLGQLRALLKANLVVGNLQIMVPMVAHLDEIRQCRRLLNQAVAELTQELAQPVPTPPLGIMVEVPAAVFQLSTWLPELDFISVGSNDLTQYLLAVDRNNAQVGEQYDSFHPAVVAALDSIARQCRGHRFGLCGELASEVPGALMLLALGYRHLSMNANALGAVHYLIRHLELNQLAALRQSLLSARDSSEVRACLSAQLSQPPLDKLSR
ncbi:phosphoenolpyruvate--protein phosphotransferase [Ferrimonas marina]|uniref:phosphoenolpyruvate--protein phosphotransferase n=1 Tax=Ferrimonas marina TaxID=299255 RepID=A0A1M5ZG36_9GAMM|nr:phosphoenolpyruvate--protein phosphotransferase [Ferrimonas marina]SHI23216.1 phosphotransferase system, enzyme I, PtsP [Ferrimonas marina]